MSEQAALNKCLRRLERCEDFKYNQQKISEIVCDILTITSHTSASKENLLSLIQHYNDRESEDKIGKGLKEIYAYWKVYLSCKKQENI